MSDQISAHLKLVQDQGAPRGDGFNPLGPRQHRWMMDRRYPIQIRVLGWAIWRSSGCCFCSLLGSMKPRTGSPASTLAAACTVSVFF